MAAVTLPSNPTNGQTFEVGSTTYTYNSTLGVWDSESPASGGSGTTVYATLAELPLSGNETGAQAFVSENNRLYLWNGSGWYNIALINTAPTITSGPNASYQLASDGTPVVLTLIAEDPEGIALTWSYSVTSGTLGSTVVSQADNVFTITPSTNSADAGEFSITFTASDGINLATAASSFTLVFTDDYYNLNSILIKTGSTSGLTNETFVDESTNHFTISKTGTVIQGSFSPYSPAGWSGYFDGSGDYLQSSSGPSDTIGTLDFTYEAWIYPTSDSAYQAIMGTSYGNNGITLFNFSGAHLVAYGNGTLIQWSNILTLNQWQHVALTRESGNLYLYHNGIKYGSSAANSQNLTLYPYYVGTPAGNGEFFFGYISDARIVKGTAVYTSNFTPPTSKLTAISGTVLLTLQDNRFVDRSTNNFAITTAGDVSVVPNSPYIPSEQYDPAVHGGSVYFDGVGSYLSVPSDADLGFVTGNFTIEFWAYWNGTHNSLGSTFVDLRSTVGATATAIYLSLSNIIYFYDGPANAEVSSGVYMNKKEWTHIALTRSSGTWRIFVNGVLAASRVSSSDLGASQPCLIGQGRNGSGNAYAGYISDLRMLDGVALYTSNFTPPTQPQPAGVMNILMNTSLGLRGANAGVYDEMGKNNISTIGNATTSTTVTKYNSTSMYFDGNGDYVRILDNPLFNFGSNDFTVECWFYGLGSNSTNGSTLLGKSNTGSFGPIALSFHPTTKYLQANFSTSGSTWAFNITTNLTYDSLKNAWHHVALVRSGSSFTLYLDGINVGTVTNSSALVNNTEAFMVGYLNYTNTFWNGYIEDVRITKGYARYTTTFTPPTAALGFSNAQ
jgi:hypothetical protein